MNLILPYGRTGLTVNVPDENLSAVLRLRPVAAVGDPVQAVRTALGQPLGTAPLQQLARGRRDACVVVSDLTRPVPNAVLLAGLLDELEAAGMSLGQIRVLIATGLHRPNTPQEWEQMGLGPALERGVAVENHVARDADSHAYVGTTSADIPALVDRRYVESDLKILTGLVEPHLMAGYSGGRKAICPGLCAAETIMRWHSPQLLASPFACAGNLYCNPVHQQALEVAALAGGADCILNVTLDEERRITGVFAGELRAAHRAAMTQAERQAKVVVDQPVDIVLTTAAGWPLDLTFYQGIKGIVAAAPIVKPGGTILIAQENAEGIGGEEFTNLMLGLDSPAQYMERALRGEVSCIDQWQLQMLEKVLQRAEILNYSTGLPPEVQARLFVTPVESVEEGLERALKRHGASARIAVLPQGPYVLACLSNDLVGSRSVADMEESA
jgi:nickel-dependent lactate racemase